MVVSSLGHYGHWDLGLIWPRPTSSATPCPNKALEAGTLCWLSQSSLTGRHQIAIWLSFCMFVYFQRL